MFYCKELWRGIKERPIVYLVFLVTLVLCTVITCVFYRLTAMQMSSVDLNDTYIFNAQDNFDNAKIYDMAARTKTTDIIHEFYVQTPTNGSSGDMQFDIRTDYRMVYFENSKTFTQQELDSRQAIAIVSVDYASKNKINNGDKLSFGGVEFIVVRKTGDQSADVILPGSVKIQMPPEAKQQSFKLKAIGGLSSQDIEKFKSEGLIMIKKVNFDSSALVGVVLGIIVLALGAINVLIAYKYISNKNMKRYLIYKTVGSSNFRIGAAMSIETFIALTISFFIGIAIDYPATKPLVGEFFNYLKPLDYLLIFAINAAMVIITLGHRIISFAKMLPIDKRYA